jgi:hypothetical protein
MSPSRQWGASVPFGFVKLATICANRISTFLRSRRDCWKASDIRLSARVDMDVLNNNPLLSAATRPGERIHLRSETLCQAGNGKGI